MVFAALFSAISTAFIVESYKSLKEDPADVSARALRLISQTLAQLANNTQTVVLPEQTEVTKFTAPTKALVVNFLLLLSLSLSVAVSLVAMLAKEWCFTYMSGRTGSPATQARRRQQRLNGLKRWKMEDTLLILPSFIQVALLLFAVGLSIFLWDVHMLAALPVVIVTGVASVLYVICTLLPFLDTYCPYGTTLTKIFQMIGRRIIRWFPNASVAISKRLGFGIQVTTDDHQQDRVTRQALQWMVTNCETPRSIDIALQSVAGASDDLPVDILNECDVPGLIKRRFVSLDARGPNPEYVMFLYSRAMLYLEGTLHPTYAIARQARVKSGRLQILMWSMQLQVDSLLKSHWNAIPSGWRQELSDSCEIFTLQGTKALRLEILTGLADNGHELEIDPFVWTEEKVRVANLALTVLKHNFHEDLYRLLASVEGMRSMPKRELAHVVFSLLVTSILVHDRWTLQKIDFPMCLLRSTAEVAGNGMDSDQLALTLAAVALSRQAYPGWINPCPLSAADRIERTVDFLLHSESVGTLLNGEWTPLLFASDAQKLGILHLLSRPELYGINEADLDILLGMLLESEFSQLDSSINIPTLPPDFNLHRQIAIDISDEITGGAMYHYPSLSHDHVHTKAILEVLQRTYHRDTVGPPPTSVYLFVLKVVCQSPDTTSNRTWTLFESFPFPTELGDNFTKEIRDLSIVYLLRTRQESSVKQQLLAFSQLWLFTSLLGRQNTDSDTVADNYSRLVLKDELTEYYGSEPVVGGRAGDARDLEQTKVNLVSRFVELLPNCPEVVPYLYHILRCMLLEERAPNSDSRWDLFGTANVSPERLAEDFSHISLPVREPVSIPGSTETNGGT